MTTKFEMEIGHVDGRGKTWREAVPDYLNHRNAPDITDMSIVDRAKATVKWFNDTAHPTERLRKLVAVYQLTEHVIYHEPEV